MPTIREQYSQRRVKKITRVELYPEHDVCPIMVEFYDDYCLFNDQKFTLIPLMTRGLYTHFARLSCNQKLFVQIKYGKVKMLNGKLINNRGELTNFKFTELKKT